MTKKVYIIHGWDGYPGEGWFPWLKKELEAKGYIVYVPAMPKPEAPEIESWVAKLRNAVGEVDSNTFFVGHSIGCQTIMRFLETLPEEVRVGGVVFVAGWTHLTFEATPDEDSKAIAKQWLESPINWGKIKSHTDKFVAVFSKDDPVVPIGEKEVFVQKLGAKIVIEENKGHFNEESGVKMLPVALIKLIKMAR